MSESRFVEALDFVLRHEGGYVDHPRDPGGATNMGITLRTLAAWRGATVTKEDVRTLTIDEAKEIYRTNYWNVMRCDELPRGLDLAVFDFGVNAGPGRVARILQRIVGVTADGSIGPQTITAVRAQDTQALIGRLAAERITYYQGLPTFDTFGRGWIRRTNDCKVAALEAAAAAPPLRETLTQTDSGRVIQMFTGASAVVPGILTSLQALDWRVALVLIICSAAIGAGVLLWKNRRS